MSAKRARDLPGPAAVELARLLATAVERRQGAPAPASEADTERIRHLLATLSADGAAAQAFFPALGRELKARGLQLPPPDQLPLPPEVLPLLATLGAGLAPADDSGEPELDYEALAQQLNAQLGELLGETPREARDRVMRTRVRERVGTRVAAALREHGLVPERDTPAGGDSFWDLVAMAGRDHAAFLRRLARLPRERLAAFYWEHVAAVMELRRAGLDAQAGPHAAERDIVDLAAQIVACGYEFHADTVARCGRPATGMTAPQVDLGADAARIFRDRFGEPLAPGL